MRSRPQPVRPIAVKKPPQTTSFHIGVSPAPGVAPRWLSRTNFASTKAADRQNT